MEATTTDLAQIGQIQLEEFQALITSAPQILSENRNSQSKAITKGNELLAMAEKGMNATTDVLLSEYIEKAKKTITAANTKRVPITQMLTIVAKEFTSIEANIKATVDKCQDFRNDYATTIMKDRQEAERLAAQKLAKDQEAIELEKNYKIEYASKYSEYILDFKTNKLEWFNTLTLQAIDQATLEIGKLDNNLSDSQFMFLISVPVLKYNSFEEYKEILGKIDQGLVYSSMDSFKLECEDFKRELLDMIPSKKIQLEELEAERIESERKKAEEAERQRLADAAAAEAKRLADQEADLEKKALLEEQARQSAAKAEDERLANEKAEAERQRVVDAATETERKRIEDEQLKLQAEAQQSQVKAEAEASVQASGQTASAFVDNQATLFTEAPKVKEGYNIMVLNPAAYLQIAQFWFENEGKNLSNDKIEAVTFGRMKAFAEKQAIKTGEMISSKLIIYDPIYKAK